MNPETFERKYTGEGAQAYEQARSRSARWQREQAAATAFLERVAGTGTRVLDVPVGTGRFFDVYDRLGVDVVGIDRSPDMVREAGDRADAVGITPRLETGDALALGDRDLDPDVIVSTRFLKWLDPQKLWRFWRSIATQSPEWVIAGARIRPSDEPLRERLVRDGYALYARTQGDVTTVHSETAFHAARRHAGYAVADRTQIHSDHRGEYHMFLFERAEGGE